MASFEILPASNRIKLGEVGIEQKFRNYLGTSIGYTIEIWGKKFKVVPSDKKYDEYQIPFIQLNKSESKGRTEVDPSDIKCVDPNDALVRIEIRLEEQTEALLQIIENQQLTKNYLEDKLGSDWEKIKKIYSKFKKNEITKKEFVKEIIKKFGYKTAVIIFKRV